MRADTHVQQWLALLLSCMISEVLAAQPRTALTAFYNAAGGPSWYNNTGWLDDSTQPCSWYGVVCSSELNVELKVMSNGLTGTIAAELWELSELGGLGLFDNAISGTVAKEMSSLTALRVLALNNNAMSGTVAEELAALTGLWKLALNDNPISGTFLAELPTMPSLRYFGLQYTSVSGTVPGGPIQPRETRIEHLLLFSTFISGTVPEQLIGLTALSSLYLQSNSLSGTMPSLVNSNINKLGLFDNQLRGRLALPEHNQLSSVLVQNNRFSCGLLVSTNSNRTSALKGERGYSSLFLPGKLCKATVKMLRVSCGQAMHSPTHSPRGCQCNQSNFCPSVKPFGMNGHLN